MSWYGESHGDVVGVVVDGVPAGVPFTTDDVQPELDRRRPGQSLVTTQRREPDEVTIDAGVLRGHTTGAPVVMTIRNADRDSSKYEATKHLPRPGHSDWPARVKFGGYNDYRGGGMFSGRLTAALVMAGALARKVLAPHNVEVAAHAETIGGVTAEGAFDVATIREHVETNPVRCADPHAAKEMEEAIDAARRDRDSVGGVVYARAEHVPTGWGEPNALTVEGSLSQALFSVPAVKAVAFGAGFDFAHRRGSEVVDGYHLEGDRVLPAVNHNGGVLGGITTGAPLEVRVAFKPTSSISRAVPTVDLDAGEDATLETHGRHDPCIVPRAVPVVEAVLHLVLADLALMDRGLQARPREPGGPPP